MNPLESQKKLLIAESELNRVTARAYQIADKTGSGEP